MSKSIDSNKIIKPRKAYLQVQSHLNSNDRVLSWFEELNSKNQVSKTFWLYCELALAEGFTNAVRHAHRDRSPELLIDIEVGIFADRIEIRIWDYGLPFDLKKRLNEKPPNTNAFAGDGRGIDLMNAIADKLSYTRTEDDRNCLLIVKNYDPNSTEDG